MLTVLLDEYFTLFYSFIKFAEEGTLPYFLN